MTIATAASKAKEPGGGTKVKERGPKPGDESVQHVDEAQAPVFGIKSYIHQFYDWKTPNILDETEGWYLIPSTVHNRKLVCIFRTMTVIGLVLLVAGAVGIMVGYMWPKQSFPLAIKKHQVIVNEDGDLLISADLVSHLTVDHMKPWKLAGLVTFAVGGVVLAISLLIPSCARMCGHSNLGGESNGPGEPPIKIFSAPAGEHLDAPKSPTQKMVPALEQVTENFFLRSKNHASSIL